MKVREHTLNIVIIAMFSAILTGGKLALSLIPNVEIVTIVIILVTATLRLKISLPVTFIFVTVDCLIYGINTWSISYYIYWPLLSITFFIYNRKSIRKPIFNAILAAIMTLSFGIITTSVDTIFSGALRNGFFERVFLVMYARGIPYFIIHIISNFTIVLLLFKPLSTLFIKLKANLYQETISR